MNHQNMNKKPLKYCPPLISFDYAIKFLLKNREDYEIIENFLSNLLPVGKHNPIKIIALLDDLVTHKTRIYKTPIINLIAEDTHKNQYIVEIERAYRPDFFHQDCFVSSRVITEFTSESQDYTNIKKIFHIVLLYDLAEYSRQKLPLPFFNKKAVLHKTEAEKSINITIIKTMLKTYKVSNILPDYCIVCLPNYQGKLETELDEWLYMLKNNEVHQNAKNPYMSKIIEKLNYLNMDESQKNHYIRYKQKMVDIRESYITKFEEGMEKGLKKGKEQGIKKEKRNIAKNMLTLGLSKTQIAQATGLSITEIENIK